MRSSVEVNFLKANKDQELLFDQVEKRHTSLLSVFKFDFHSWLQITTEFTTDWAAASVSSFLQTVVRIETSSA